MEKKQRRVASMNLLKNSKEEGREDIVYAEPTNAGERVDAEFKERPYRQSVWGWNSAMDAANDLWASIHSSLLGGEPIFAFKNTASGDLSQLVVVRNMATRDYAVGQMTTGFSMLLPHTSLDYLKTQVLDDLKKYKIDKNIIETYKQIIDDETASN